MVFYHLNRKITYTDILQAIILKCKKKKKSCSIYHKWNYYTEKKKSSPKNKGYLKETKIPEKCKQNDPMNPLLFIIRKTDFEVNEVTITSTKAVIYVINFSQST